MAKDKDCRAVLEGSIALDCSNILVKVFTLVSNGRVNFNINVFAGRRSRSRPCLSPCLLHQVPHLLGLVCLPHLTLQF